MNEALRESAIAFTAADSASQKANDEKQAALMKINTIIADELRSAGINARVVTCGRGACYSINIQILSPDDVHASPSSSAPDNDPSMESPDPITSGQKRFPGVARSPEGYTE